MKATRQFLIGPGALDCNRGDQALLWQAIDALRTIEPRARIAILSEGFADPHDGQSRQTRQRDVEVLAPFIHNPRRSLKKGAGEFIDSRASVLRMAIRAMGDFLYSGLLLAVFHRPSWALRLLDRDRQQTYRFLRGCDALVIKGGGYLYAYPGLKWAYYIWFGLLPLMLAQRAGVKVIVLPNSFGPFETQWARTLARKVLGRCDLVTSREPLSHGVLDRLIPGRVHLFPDMAFGLRAEDVTWARAELATQGVPGGRRVGITLRPWRFPKSADPQARYEAYIDAHVRFIEHLLDLGYVPCLFAHVVGPHAHEDDRIALRDTLDSLTRGDRVYYLDGDYNCRNLKALYGLMDSMLCTRFHSAIFSIAQQVPCIAISYQGFKATGIMAQAGLAEYAIPIDQVTGPGLIAAFEGLTADRDRILHKMALYTTDCRQRLAELDRTLATALFAPGQHV